MRSDRPGLGSAIERYWPELTVAVDFVLANRLRFASYIASDIMQALVMYFIWNAAAGQSSRLGGMDRTTMVTYVFVAQACRLIVAYDMESQFAGYIRTGDVIRDLIVPQIYVWKRLWFTIGWLSTIGGVTVIPLMTIGLLFFGVTLPPLRLLPALAVSLFLAMLINYGISSLVGSLAFWTDGSVWGVSVAKQWIISFTGGAFIPLALFPKWLEVICKALPFQAGVNIPTTIYLGQVHGVGLWQLLGIQALWAAGLVFAAERFFNFSLRKMTIPGG
ncbi:MAG: ABC transporter permease [Mycobacterium leprae]